MINLLPPQEKRLLLKESNKRLALVLCFVALISLVCLVLMLLALYFYMLVHISFTKGMLDEAKGRYQTTDFLEYKNLISQYNGMLTKTDDFYKKEVYFANVLNIISSLPKPGAVHLKSIAMEPLKNGSVKASISGNANVRENLLSFKNAIETDKNITNIYFPPDNWIKSANINFFVTFEIIPKKNELSPK